MNAIQPIRGQDSLYKLYNMKYSIPLFLLFHISSVQFSWLTSRLKIGAPLIKQGKVLNNANDLKVTHKTMLRSVMNMMKKNVQKLFYKNISLTDVHKCTAEMNSHAVFYTQKAKIYNNSVIR